MFLFIIYLINFIYKLAPLVEKSVCKYVERNFYLHAVFSNMVWFHGEGNRMWVSLEKK